MKKLLCFLLLLSGIYQPQVFSEPLEASVVIANETVNLGTLETGRPSQINLWFPQGHCANLPEKIFCLADSAITDKAIILSHGAMGSAQEYSWLAQALAEAGFVVVGVNHFGESWVYGQQTQSVRSTNLIWQRPQDISAILNQLSSQEIFQHKINWNHIIAVGHSSGGQTTAMLAGATFDLKRLMAYCNSDASKEDKSCQYGSSMDNIPEAFLKKFSEPQCDTRVKTLVMLDPAIGAAVIPDSLQKIQLPTLIVGIKNNDFLTWEHQGLNYAANIPKATLNLLSGNEGHFIFLNLCNNQVKVMGVALCEDRAGVDRTAAHNLIATSVLAFIHADHQAIATQNSMTKKIGHSNFSALLEIISYTPKWVFGLLAILIAFGLLQTRTRQVRIQVALILPIAMLILSLSGVANYVGFHLVTAFCWLLGISLTCLLVIKLIASSKVHYDANSNRIVIPGSWVPLLVILGIFFTRYTLGVAMAMDLSWTHANYFSSTVSLLLGAWSGYFLARGIVFLRARPTRIDG